MASKAVRAPAAAPVLLLAAGAVVAASVLMAARAHAISGGGSIDGCRVTSPCVYFSPPAPDPFLAPPGLVIAEPQLLPAAAPVSPQRPSEAFLPVPQLPPIFV